MASITMEGMNNLRLIDNNGVEIALHVISLQMEVGIDNIPKATMEFYLDYNSDPLQLSDTNIHLWVKDPLDGLKTKQVKLIKFDDNKLYVDFLGLVEIEEDDRLKAIQDEARRK